MCELLTIDKAEDLMRFSNSYDRFPVLFEMYLYSEHGELSSDDFAQLLGENYPCCDNLFRYKDEVKHAFDDAACYPDRLMTKDALDRLSQLPNSLSIYRGMTLEESSSGDLGISWTLHKGVA